jgi:DNA-binding NtrC family response regulator
MFEREPSAYNAVLLDMSMEGMGAEELGRRILQANPKVVLIAASGYPADLTKLEKSSPGRVTFLHKPFTPEMLAECINRMVGH